MQIINTLQNIIEEMNVPEILSIDDKVTYQKKLFSYQKQALSNALKVLYLYFNDYKQDKDLFAKDFYYQNPMYKNLHLNIKDVKIDEINKFFNIVDNKILFDEIVNRISFWMATGSGKSVVILKLIDLIFRLQELNLLPKKNLLFLTYREDLLKSFINLIEEYNKDKSLFERIEIVSLKDYEEYNNKNPRTVYVYRSDLISNEKKENILNYKDYLSNDFEGDWYVILDEAHKGASDSKRHIYFSILAKKGFLFNFSATFVELIDIVPTIYNLNLYEFIKKGYGKKIFLFQKEVKSFKKEFSYEDKEKIVLKNFILLTALKKASEKLKNYYHSPMLIFLMNTINIENSDLLLIFDEINKISQGINLSFFEESKKDIINEFNSYSYIIGNDSLSEFVELIDEIKVNDIYKYVFNSCSAGNIEIITTLNKNELLLKHSSSDKIFALIKIGSVNSLLSKMKKFKITKQIIKKDYFLELDTNNDVNILLGSRAFYEGWDSNRPNIITFINIGVGKEAKKFVLQSIGRGVRIEPIKGIRQRSEFLEIETLKNNKYAKFLESLFVFATNKKSLEEIFNNLKNIKIDEQYKKVPIELNKFEIDLLVPKFCKKNLDYKKMKFLLSDYELKLLTSYLKCIAPDKFIIKHKATPTDFEKIQKLINNKHFNVILDSKRAINVLIKDILEYINNETLVLEKFEKLTDEIIHFNFIKIPDTLFDKLQQKISQEIIELNIKHHLYSPLLYSKKLNIKYLLSNEEFEFIKENENLFDDFNFCFCKLEPIDNVYIPYLHNGKTQKHHPSFIFWIKNNNKYKIVLLDLKAPKNFIEIIEGFKESFNKSIIDIEYKILCRDCNEKEFFIEKKELKRIFE